MAVINVKDNDLARESNYDCDFKINSLTRMTNVAFQQFVILQKYLFTDEMTVKWYGHNNTRQFTRVKPEMSGCKLWPVGGTGGHCFV